MAYEVVNGIRLYLEVHGEGAPILCVHGTSSSAKAWQASIVPLQQLGKLLVYDRRGCTRSERPEPYESTTVEEHAADAAALLERVVDRPAIVIGRSYGGGVALDLAMRRPELVRALVLLEASAEGFESEFDDWALQLNDDVLAIAAERGVGAVGEAFIKAVVGDEGWDRLPPEWQEMFIDNGQAILAEISGGELAVDREMLSQIAQPTLVVVADASPEPLRTLNFAIAESIPGAKVGTVGGGHLIDPGDPVVLEFVASIIDAPA